MSTQSEKPDKTKRRSDMACRRCRARKLKCENKDSVAPCKRCDAEHVECVFVPVADDAKPPKTATSSRGGSEDSRSNTQPASASPTQLMPPASLPSERSPNQHPSQIRGTFTTPPIYYPQAVNRQPQSGNASPPAAERTGSGFQHPSYRQGGDFPAVDGPTNPWSSSTQPAYPTHQGIATQYVNRGLSRPSVPTSPPYAYSPASESYTQPTYGSDHQPRGIPSQSYYSQGEAAHSSQTSQQQYYMNPNGHYQPQPEPSGLPGYPDPNIDPQQHDNSNFYGHYTR